MSIIANVGIISWRYLLLLGLKKPKTRINQSKLIIEEQVTKHSGNNDVQIMNTAWT